MPSVTSPVLNHTVTCFEKNLSAVIQFETDFARHNNVEVYGVRNVHTRMIWLQNLYHPRQLLLNFFESGRAADFIDTLRAIRRYSEEPKAETIL